MWRPHEMQWIWEPPAFVLLGVPLGPLPNFSLRSRLVSRAWVLAMTHRNLPELGPAEVAKNWRAEWSVLARGPPSSHALGTAP
jgi:hypothetical protein